MRRPRQWVAVLLLCLLAACGKDSSPTPSPGGGTGETITGRERIGWDQPAASPTELARFRYAIYVDGVRSELPDVNCAGSAGPAGFACSGRLPAMSSGSHTLELASFFAPDGPESPRSAPLRVTVAGLVTGGVAGPLTTGEILTTADGVRLRAEVLFEGLRQSTALAVTPDGRAFVGTADGLVIISDGTFVGSPQLTTGPIVALALSPEFARDAQLYVVQAVSSETEGPRFRTMRYRELAGRLGERMVLLENGPASDDPAAAIRVHSDGKLYTAFDDGGSAARSQRLSDWSGKVLRMELDGRTPADQAAASPVLFAGLTSPRGFDWSPDGSAIWIADASRDGIERLRVIATTTERPRRAGQRGTFTLPAGLGAAGVAFYRADAIAEFTGDLLIGGRDGGYILRIRFDPRIRASASVRQGGRENTSAHHSGRPISTERLLEGRVSTVRALTVGHDGAIYFCTDTSLIRLRKAG